MHLPLVLCGTVCFLGTLLFQEGFRQNTMLNTATSIYEENISKFSDPLGLDFTLQKTAYIYMLIHIF